MSGLHLLPGPPSTGNPSGVTAPSDPSNHSFPHVDSEHATPAREQDRADIPDDVPIEQLTSEPPPIVESKPAPEAKPAVHLGRVVDPDVEDEDEPEAAKPHGSEPDSRPVKHMGRIVDPDVAEEGDIPIEQLSSEPPPIVERKRRSLPDEPSLRPHTHKPMPSSEELLDPGNAPPPIPRQTVRRVSPSVLTPRMTAVFGALFGLAGIIAVFAVLHRVSPQSAKASPAVTVTESTSASSAAVPVATRALSALADFDNEPPPLPGPWRVSELADDGNIRMVSGEVGLQPFVTTLQGKGVSKKETYRILAAFKKFDRFKRPGRHDEFLVAWDRSKRKVVGFELKVSALEVYQAKENDEGLLVGNKLDMKVATRMRETAIRITGESLAADLKRGQLRESVASVIDAAFDGRASVSSMPKNSTLRVILQEKTALGRFAEYDHVVALEYASAKSEGKAMRLYRFKDGHRHGYFDQEGREPYRGGWRMPCPGAPITSPFNPKRMHPVLKRIKPHNGTDFGAPTGTPIHATSYGKVSWIAPRGPAGNLIIIDHPGDTQSYYMHMHRFAPGLKKGDKVESFQVIGTVGTTGRSTGPHLHFGIKRKGKWINPMSLQLDGHRLVTASRRADFEKVKEEQDKKLDAIELPPPVEDAAPAEATDTAEDTAEDTAGDTADETAEATEEPVDDTPKPGPADDKPSEPDHATPRENYDDDDEELEPIGSVNDEPVDEVY